MLFMQGSLDMAKNVVPCIEGLFGFIMHRMAIYFPVLFATLDVLHHTEKGLVADCASSIQIQLCTCN